MRLSIHKVLVLAFLLHLAVALPAMAQATPAGSSGKLGVGLSFLGDDGGMGVTVDYAHPFHPLSDNRSIAWVGDFSFHGNDVGDSGIEVDLKSLTYQGGVRYTAPLGASSKLTWHAQGLLGVMHVSAGADNLLEDICDDLGIDCDEDETGFIFSPGAGIDYWFNPRFGFRGQLDFPIGEGGVTTRVWFGLSRRFGGV